MYALSFRDLDAYDDYDGTSSIGHNKSIPPFWAVVNNKSYGGPEEREKALLKWKNDVTQCLLEWKEPITRVQRMNLKLYKGSHYFSHRDLDRLPYEYRKNKVYSKNHAKIVLNYLHFATEQHVSDLSSYEPALTVGPANNEELDKQAARANKEVIDYYFYEWDVKNWFQVFHRRKKVLGEDFGFVLWNSELGEYHPRYREYRQILQDQGQDPDSAVPLVDPTTGEEVIGEDGEPLFVTRPVMTGDIQLVHEFSERVLYPFPESGLRDDVPYVIRLVPMPIEEIRARWPSKYGEIKKDTIIRGYRLGHQRSLHEHVWVRYLYHKPTTFLEKGYYCVSTESATLEAGNYPFSHKKLPIIWGTDIDIPGEVTGMSFFQNLASLNYALNDSTSMILQNQTIYSHPKYAVPRGAKVRSVDLGDDRTIYEYSGPKPPELMAPNSTPSDTWRWRDALRDEFQTLSMVFATSRGRGVDGITANVALRLIDEQERKLHKPSIDKHDANCVVLGQLILSTLGTYRDPSDGMMIKILGKNNERYLKYFDIANLSRAWEVRLQKSSALPDSPAARTQTILDLSAARPHMWSDDEFLEYLDIKRPEKLIESATVARQAAESEVEDIFQGIDVPPPTQYHDILPKYRVYAKAVQSKAFDEAEPIIKQKMLNMIVTAEYLIWKKMKLNPTFQQLVLTKHENFPMFFPLPKAEIQPYMLPSGADYQPLGAMGMMGAGAPPLGGLTPEAATSAPTPPAEQQIPQNLPPQPGQTPAEASAPEGSLP